MPLIDFSIIIEKNTVEEIVEKPKVNSERNIASFEWVEMPIISLPVYFFTHAPFGGLRSKFSIS
jgi:hypothetical protein